MVRSTAHQDVADLQRLMAKHEPLPLVRRQLETSAQRLEDLAVHKPSGQQEKPGRTPLAQVDLGRLTLNCDARSAKLDGIGIQLAPQEFALLALLGFRKDTIVSKVQLYEKLYGQKARVDPKIVDVLICKLRRKLAVICGGENLIGTVRGGYVMASAAEAVV
jgi:DNA-binding response OmpR family regulator